MIDLSHLHALAWLTTLARAFVLPVLGSALALIVAPRLPPWARRLGPALVRAALVLLVLAAYGPVAGELTLRGAEDAPLYRLASLVVLVCAVALVVVLPLLAEGVGAPRALAPVPSPAATVASRPAASPRPLPERPPPAPRPTEPAPPPAPRSVYPSATFAGALARPRASPPAALPFVTAEVVPARLVATRQEEAALTLEEEEDDDAGAGPLAATGLAEGHLGTRVRLTPPRIAPVRPDETVRVPSPRSRPAAPVEPLPPTHAMPRDAQARLLAATAGPRTTPRLVPPRRGAAPGVRE